jgi:hypothetical protein
MTGQAQTHVLNVQGNAYDSFFTQFGGNCITVPAALINQGTTNSSMRRSHITDWKLEGRDDLTDDEPPEPHPTVNAKIFVSSVTDKSKLPKIRNVSWTYSLNGDEYPDVSTNSYIGDFTNDTWVTILSKEYIKYNAHMIVTATIGDNSVVGHVLVTKKPSAATVNVRDIGTQVACSFRDSSGDLQMKQTSGSDKTDIRITMIDYGGDHADG